MIKKEEIEKVYVGWKSYKRLYKEINLPGLYFLLFLNFGICEVIFTLF